MEAKERPILFSAPMVKALLRDEKTQTRRIIKPQPEHQGHDVWLYNADVFASTEEMRDHLFHNVYGTKGTPYGSLWGYDRGDRMWVREAFAMPVMGDARSDCPIRSHDIAYRADVGKTFHPLGGNYTLRDDHCRWRPSIHMPRWASRITLEITDVRVQRLQEISEEDARAEGVADGGCESCGNPEPCRCSNPRPNARDSFINLWNSINGERGKCKTCRGHGVVASWAGSIHDGTLTR